MRFTKFLPSVFQIPFHKKKLLTTIIVGLSAAVFASAEIKAAPQNGDAGEIRQSIKRADKLTRRGDLDEAEQILRGVIDENPNHSAAKLSLAYNLIKQHRLLESYDLALPIVQAEPKNSYAFAVLGTAFLNAGNFREARVALVNALVLDNEEALAWAGLGLLDFYENRIVKSMEKLREAIYFEPREADFVYALAQVAARAEKYQEAAAAYSRFLDISSTADTDRRDRLKGLINFLRFLGSRQTLYAPGGAAQTIVPFKLVNDRPVVQIRLKKNGEPLNFVLDTGSGISVISAKAAEKLKIKAVARGGLARGLGGDGKFEIVYGFVPTIFVGQVRINSVPVYIRDLRASSDKIDGYIGLSLISKFLTTIDYGSSTFALSSGETLDNQPQSDLFVPLRLTTSGFLSGEVNLEGVDFPLNFIIDTGASISVISSNLSATKEISPFVRDEKMRVIGAAGITENVPSFMLPRVSFGTHTQREIKAVALNLDIVNEASGFEQAGILGGNFLKNYSLTFDFKNSKVIFVPNQ